MLMIWAREKEKVVHDSCVLLIAKVMLMVVWCVVPLLPPVMVMVEVMCQVNNKVNQRFKNKNVSLEKERESEEEHCNGKTASHLQTGEMMITTTS